jgi:hypothetical protein
LAKKTKIRFDLDGAEVVTTRAYLRIGLPAHPTYGKPQIGDLYKDNKGNTIELVAKEGTTTWRIRWHKDGAETTRELPAIKSGCVTHPTDGKVEVGQIWTTSSGLDVEVIESDSKLMKTEYPAHSIQTAMKDGFITKALNGSGVVTSMSTNMSRRGGFNTTICFVTHDLHEFVHQLENFGWKAFSDHFDKEVEDTLKD